MIEKPQSSKKIEIASLNSECYKRIKKEILTGKLAWGERLDVIKLANDFAISRSPVVKAIDRLAMEQLVEVTPNKGSFVATPTKEDIKEISEIRIMIEMTTCQLAYTKNKDSIIRELEKNESFMKENSLKGIPLDFEQFLLYDRKFHCIFAEGAENKRLLNFFNSIRSQAELFRTRTYYGDHIKQAWNSHLKIIKALKNDNLTEALSQMKKHIEDVHQDTLESLHKDIDKEG